MKQFKRFAVLMLAVCMIAGLCACAVNPPDPVEISAEEEAVAMGFSAGAYDNEIAVGEYAFFDVIIKIDYEYEVQWSSSDHKIATVDSNGRVDGISPGKVTITAKAKKATIDYEVTVKKAKSQPLSMTTAIVSNKSSVDQNLQSENATNPYAVLVNLKTKCITVYTYNAYGIYNVAVRAMVCAAGSGTKTAEGSYSSGSKEEWYHNSSEGRYYQYSTKFGEDYRFCSAPYSDKDPSTLIAEEYNKLGTSGTNGDIWLSVSDAKWIYENCNENTLVKVTNTDGEDPLGVPKTMKLTDKSKSTSWDPTDDSKDNPYRKINPTFKGVEEAQVIVNGTFDAYDGVMAYDTCGKATKEGITIDGSVPCNKEGRYIISYYYTDALNRTARADRVVNVVSEDDFQAEATQ